MPSRRTLHDRYFKEAKAEGYLARSAFKLIQINEKKKLIRPGEVVADLGCAPGSWLQVASELVGPKGLVVGIDLQEPPRHTFPPNVRWITGDIYRVPPQELLALAGGPFRVVLSDMAPSTTGHGDHFLSVRLCRRVLEILPELLAPGGNTAVKVFEGEEYPALLNEYRRCFRDVAGFKPQASREVSREMYIIGHGFIPPRAGAKPPKA